MTDFVIDRSTGLQPAQRSAASSARDRKAPRAGISRWRALEPAQFRALIADPRPPGRTEEEPTSC
jgi:hypothetical protein